MLQTLYEIREAVEKGMKGKEGHLVEVSVAMQPYVVKRGKICLNLNMFIVEVEWEGDDKLLYKAKHVLMEEYMMISRIDLLAEAVDVICRRLRGEM